MTPRRAARQIDLEIANFVAIFGEHKLLDVFEDRVWPLFGQVVTRRTGETYQYQFHHVRVDTVDGAPVVTGRILARMNLRSRQRLEGQRELVPTEDSIPSDPSTIFALRLQDHKLFLMPEQPRSPRTKTVQWMFKKLFEEHRQQAWRTRREEELHRLGRGNLPREESERLRDEFDMDFPEVDFRLTSISTKNDAENLLSAFEVVRTVKITARVTNNEDIDLDEELLKRQRQVMEQAGGETSDVVFSNKKTGLKKEQVRKLVGAAAATGGNCSFKISGASTEGVAISKTENDSRVRLKVEREGGERIATLVSRAFDVLKRTLESGLFRLAPADQPEAAANRAHELATKLQSDNDQ